MPRRAAIRPTATVVSEETEHTRALALLRRQWKWAAFSQFFHTFAVLFAMPDVSVNDIEDDLTGSGAVFLPRIMARLLLVLSQDRKITVHNWQLALRRQHARRDPGTDPLAPIPTPASPSPSRSPTPHDDQANEGDGSAKAEADDEAKPLTIEEDAPATVSDEKPEAPEPEDAPPDLRPLDWLDLPMLAKLDSMHLLTEWQFQNPARFRSTMKSDDEDADWRIEPIGYDAHGSAYWLIGEDRLWIQRHPPKPPPSSKKRKRPATAISNSRDTKRRNGGARTAPAPPAAVKPSAQASRTSSRTNQAQQSAPTNGTTRTAKLQAKSKLDKQAKEMARWQAEARSRGTRISARLRGAEDGEEWQEVPEEWLKADAKATDKSAGRGSRRTRSQRPPTPSPALGSGEESELTELSDLSEDEDKDDDDDDASPMVVEAEIPDKEPSPEPQEEEAPPALPADFVEWETICVTLYDWEHVAERFQGTTHYSEKALYKLLSSTIVPGVINELREIERKKQLEEAVSSRKRSSRLAGKEAERETARQIALKQQEEEKELARVKRLQARQQREETTRAERDAARERRRIEREAKEKEEEASREAGADANANGEIDVEGDAAVGMIPRAPSGPDPAAQYRAAHRPPPKQEATNPGVSHRRGGSRGGPPSHYAPAPSPQHQPYPMAGHPHMSSRTMHLPPAEPIHRGPVNGSVPPASFQQYGMGMQGPVANGAHTQNAAWHPDYQRPVDVQQMQSYMGHYAPGPAPYQSQQMAGYAPSPFQAPMQPWQQSPPRGVPYAGNMRVSDAGLMHPTAPPPMHASPAHYAPLGDPNAPVLYPGYGGAMPGLNGSPAAMQQMRSPYTYSMPP